MSRTLTLEISDDVYGVLCRRAEAAGTSPAAVAATSLEQQFGRASAHEGAEQVETTSDQQTMRERFERHFGAVDLGRPTGAGNDRIDADLAREYADTHEPA